MRLTAYASVIALVAAGNAFAQVTSGSAQVEDDIAEALFRSYVTATDGKARFPEVWCISVPGEGRVSRVALRLSNADRPVLVAAECTSDKGEGMRERDSARSAILLWIKRIRIVAEGEAEVEGGTYKHKLHSAGYLFTLRKNQTGWEITARTMQWIS